MHFQILQVSIVQNSRTHGIGGLCSCYTGEAAQTGKMKV